MKWAQSRPAERVEATIGTGIKEQPKTKAWLVVSVAIPELPKHKRSPYTEQERAAQGKKRELHLASKGRPRNAVAKRYKHTWVLFTTAETVPEGVRQYARRMTIEETFRDCHQGHLPDCLTKSSVGHHSGLAGVIGCSYL